jgi:hypothetical protein
LTSGFHEYQDEITQYIQKLEQATQPNSRMIATQPEFSWDSRSMLIDFVIDSHLTLKLSDESLYLAINVIDRYCSKRVVKMHHFQLFGCTALWIASKYVDRTEKIPTVKELSSMCDDAYTNQMFKQMEMHILNSLKWDLSHPTFDLLVDICSEGNAYKRLNLFLLKRLALYLCEVTMYHQEFIDIKPSQIAALAMNLAKHIIYDTEYLTGENIYEEHIKKLLLNFSFEPSEYLKQRYTRLEFSNSYCYIQMYQKRENAKVRLQELREKGTAQTKFSSYSPPLTDEEEKSDKYDVVSIMSNGEKKELKLVSKIKANGPLWEVAVQNYDLPILCLR